MKFSKLFLGITLSTATLGAAVGSAFALNNSGEKAQSAEAAAGDKVIYVDIDLNSKFKESGCNPYVHYYNGSDQYVALNAVSNNIMVTASALPADVFTNGSYGFEVYCWNQAGKGNDCTTTWIYGNGTLQYANYNYVCIAGYSSGKQNQIKGYGYYSATHEIVNPGASAATQRIFINNDNSHGFYDNDDWGTPCKNVIGYTYNSQWHTIEMPVFQNSVNEKYYYYADIPASVTDFHLMRMSRNSNHKYLVYLDGYCSEIVYGKCYYVGTYSYDDAKNLTPDAVGNASDDVLVKVVEAYLTCSTTASNGCNSTTVANLKATWFDGKDVTATLTTTFTDYANGNTSYTGSKTRTTTINEKWTAMQNRASSSNVVTPLIIESNSTALLIAVAIIGVLACTALGFYFFKRRETSK